MTDYRKYAEQLIEEFNLCCKAKPRHNAVNLQLTKDSCSKFAYHLSTQMSWGTEQDIAEACHQLEPRLKKLKEQLILEVLTHGV